MADRSREELVDDIKGALIHPEALDELLRAHARDLASKIRDKGPDYYEDMSVGGAWNLAAAVIDPDVPSD